MKITKIWFTADHIFGRDEEGSEILAHIHKLGKEMIAACF